MRKNIHYFKVNYLIWVMTVLVICMLANPASLVVLSGAGCHAAVNHLAVHPLTSVGASFVAWARVSKRSVLLFGQASAPCGHASTW